MTLIERLLMKTPSMFPNTKSLKKPRETQVTNAAVTPVVFSKLARREVDAAARWMEDRTEGRGSDFYLRVQEAAEKIQLNSYGFQTVYKDLRRVGLRQFK